MLLQYDWQLWKPQRGEIYLVDLGDNMDSEQSGLRPVLIISNNIGNSQGSIVVIVPLSSRNKNMPTHVPVDQRYGVKVESYILTEHIRSISKRRFFAKGKPVLIGMLPLKKMAQVEEAIKVELGMIS
ncbi:MAG: type II toxin-antitoxin system PemK/MazF family toxin [Methanofastidiosum sp.]|jgi:mRNA interferase MazF